MIDFFRFELCPSQEVDFGYLRVNSEKTTMIQLRNIGHFDFNYFIMSHQNIINQKQKCNNKINNKHEGSIRSSLSSKNKKDKNKNKSGAISKSNISSNSERKEKNGKSKHGLSSSTSTPDSKSKLTKKKNKKFNETGSIKSSINSGSDRSKKTSKKHAVTKFPKTKLTAGCFQLKSSTGVLQPNTEAIIHITCKPNICGLIQETVFFFISECKPNDRKGKQINLEVTGCIPIFNFTAFHSIFFECDIINNLQYFSWQESVSLSIIITSCHFLINVR